MIPIKRVIKAFSKALEDYKSIDLEIDYWFLPDQYCCGLCNYLKLNGYYKIIKIFSPGSGYYKNYINPGKYYLFDPPNVIYYCGDKKWQKGITDRIKFLKREIPYLRGLLKKGYTHI